jgi:predicted transcriptional regulator
MDRIYNGVIFKCSLWLYYSMKLLCEIIVGEVLPALRAIIAKELMQLGLNQIQISKKLGITQPAVSQYMRELRGHHAKMLTSNEDVVEAVKVLAHEIATGDIEASELHMKICEICKTIKKQDLFYKLHQESYPLA